MTKNNSEHQNRPHHELFSNLWRNLLSHYPKVYSDPYRLQKNKYVQIIKADYSENKGPNTNNSLTLLFFNRSEQISGPSALAVYSLNSDEIFCLGYSIIEKLEVKKNDSIEYQLDFPEEISVEDFNLEVFDREIPFQNRDTNPA
jgi:hypothetical protein